MAEIETEAQPDRINDDIRRESVALISIHWQILSISTSSLGNTHLRVLPKTVAFEL